MFFILHVLFFIGVIIILLKTKPEETISPYNRRIKSCQKIKRISDLHTLIFFRMPKENLAKLNMLIQIKMHTFEGTFLAARTMGYRFTIYGYPKFDLYQGRSCSFYRHFGKKEDLFTY